MFDNATWNRFAHRSSQHSDVTSLISCSTGHSQARCDDQLTRPQNMRHEEFVWQILPAASACGCSSQVLCRSSKGIQFARHPPAALVGHDTFNVPHSCSTIFPSVCILVIPLVHLCKPAFPLLQCFGLQNHM